MFKRRYDSPQHGLRLGCSSIKILQAMPYCALRRHYKLSLSISHSQVLNFFMYKKKLFKITSCLLGVSEIAIPS